MWPSSRCNSPTCDCFPAVLQALFTRLLLQEPGNFLIYMTSCSTVNLSADRDAGEKNAIPYLFACYQRAKEEVWVYLQGCMLTQLLTQAFSLFLECKNNPSTSIIQPFDFSAHQVTKVPEKLLSFAVRCKNLTVSNTRTVLLTPEIYVSQNIYEQLLDLLLEGFSRARRLRPLRRDFTIFPSFASFGRSCFYKVSVFQSKTRLWSLLKRSLLAYYQTWRCVPSRRWSYQCSISSRGASKIWSCASRSFTPT